MNPDIINQLDQIRSLCSGLPEWALNYIMKYSQALIAKARSEQKAREYAQVKSAKARADQKAGADDEA